MNKVLKLLLISLFSILQLAFSARLRVNTETNDLGSVHEFVTNQKDTRERRLQQYYEQIQKLKLDDNDESTVQHLDRNATNQKFSGVRHINRIEDMVNKVKKDNRVLITCTDYSYLDSFYISYSVSHLWKYSNFFVVALDKHAYDVLDSHGIPVALIKSKKTTSVVQNQKYNDYGSHNFNQIVKLKLVAALKILSMNVGVLLLDSDIVLFQEPFTGLPKNDSFDVIAQKDTHICTGFIYFLPTTNSKRLIELSLERMERKEVHDQEALLEIVHDGSLPELQWRLFHPPDYNRGSIFFEKHQFCWKPVGSNVVMAHNNFVVGRSNKIYRLKETGLYNMDIDEEYSSLTAKYLVLENYGKEKSTYALKVFLKMANDLDRHMVLPSFPCEDTNREDTECNLCGYQPLYCQKDIMKDAKLSWKEHVFFHNKHVPYEVKRDYLNAPLIILAQRKSECKEIRMTVSGFTKCVLIYSPQQSIKVLLEKYQNDRVIRLYKIPQGLEF